MQVIVQDESKNPYGTHKDRRSAYIVANAAAEGISTLCLITSGNSGYSLAMHAQDKGMRVVCIVDSNLKPSIKERLRAVSEVVEVDLSERILKPEEVVALARQNDEEAIWDVTNGYAAAYEGLAQDVARHDCTDVICPVGSGELYVGLSQALAKLGKRPRIIGVGVKTHPSFADKLSTPWTPYQQMLKEVEAEGNPIIRLSEDEVRDVYERSKERYACEPSSAVVWAALEKVAFASDARVVVVNSGRGLF